MHWESVGRASHTLLDWPFHNPSQAEQLRSLGASKPTNHRPDELQQSPDLRICRRNDEGTRDAPVYSSIGLSVDWFHTFLHSDN